MANTNTRRHFIAANVVRFQIRRNANEQKNQGELLTKASGSRNGAKRTTGFTPAARSYLYIFTWLSTNGGIPKIPVGVPTRAPGRVLLLFLFSLGARIVRFTLSGKNCTHDTCNAFSTPLPNLIRSLVSLSCSMS